MLRNIVDDHLTVFRFFQKTTLCQFYSHRARFLNIIYRLVLYDDYLDYLDELCFEDETDITVDTY